MRPKRSVIAGLFVMLPLVWLLAAPLAATRTLGLSATTNQVGQYERIAFALAVSTAYTNAFDPAEVDVALQIVSPTGRRLVLPAFFGQDYHRSRAREAPADWMYPFGPAGWKARFAPVEPGVHEAVATLRDREGQLRSKPVRFTCRSSPRKGFVRVSAQDPRFLEFADGQSFFPIGQNLAFIGEQQYVTPAKAEHIFDQLATNGANYLRVWTGCDDWALAIEARKSAFGRSWDWHPPIVPCPDDAGRKCLLLTSSNATVRVDPSHRVALRANTRYVFSGRLMTDPGVSLRLEGVPGTTIRSWASDPPRAWTDFAYSLETGGTEAWWTPLSFRLDGAGTAWLKDLSLREAIGGPELLWEANLDRKVRGFYNPLDCFLLDELVEAAEHHGIYLQLCLLTRDLYMGALKDPASAEYDRAIADAKKLFRYAVARWGYSPNVAAWEYWNEMDPGLPTDRFYAELGGFLEGIDVYHHLRTTSTWGPSAKDAHHAKLDFADTHFYLRPSDKNRLRDEVDAVLDRTRWLREQAPGKPVHLGEFGLANEKWQPTEEMNRSRSLVDFHNGLWASALSGASGTALFWWWDRLDQRNHYPLYRPLSRFVADVPWSSGDIRTASASARNDALRVVGLQAGRRAWLWLFDPAASWANVVVAQHPPPAVTGAAVELKGLPSGEYRLQWFDTGHGALVREDRVATTGEALGLVPPTFVADIACKVTP